VIDDPEFFALIDAWIAQQLSDSMFFQAVDLWISQSLISSARLSSTSTSVHGIVRQSHSVRTQLTFVAKGARIAATSVAIYDLNGRVVFTGEVTGAQLKWDLESPDGHLLANGVYVYVMRVRDLDGRTVRNDPKKLLILR